MAMAFLRSKKVLFLVPIIGLFAWFFYMIVEFDTSGSFSQPADKTAETQSTGSSSTETPQTNRQAEALPITPKLPLTAATYETKFSESLIRANKIRIETELANGELAQEKNAPFDVHLSFDVIAGRCSSRFNFPERYPPSEIQFLRLVKAGTALNTEQARISYKYVSGFYQSVCNALSPETGKRLGVLNSRMRNARQLLDQNSSEPDMARLIKISNESSSISEVSYALQIMSPFLIVKPVSYLLLWQQPYMRAGSAMPSRADRVNSKTIELVGLLFYCKNRPDECMSGTYFTVLSCESYYVCAPGLDVNAYLAMQHSQDRLLAANQIADALIAQRRTQIPSRPQR